MAADRDSLTHTARHRASTRVRQPKLRVNPAQLDLGDVLHWGLRPDRYGRQRLLTVYLAGPIAGLSYGEAAGWRDRVGQELANHAPHIRCLDPMRGKQEIEASPRIEAGRGGDLYGPEMTVARDLWDIESADVILMNLAGVSDVSIGSMIELGHAAALRKLVIVVLPEQSESHVSGTNPHDHPFVRQVASGVVGSLDDAIELLKAA
jgi:hypothetical protein